MIELPLSIACIGGYAYWVRRWLGFPFRYVPLWVTSFLILALFLCAMANVLREGALFLATLGLGLSGLGLISLWRERHGHDPFGDESTHQVALLLVGCMVGFYCARNVFFSVIDDYVYWGILGKYLAYFHHLPDMKTTIYPRHLAYTPGAALFHYMGYQFGGRYDVGISYFAQNIVAISALFVMVKKNDIKSSIFFICLLTTLMVLQFGSIFSKLSVDHLLALYVLAILWIYFSKETISVRLVGVSVPLLVLFLFKQIGFFLALVLVAIMLADTLRHHPEGEWRKRNTVAFLLCLGACLFLVKLAWESHCGARGFDQFARVIDVQSMVAAVDLVHSPHVRQGAFLFVESILWGPADRLKLPYLVWYALLIYLWYRIFKGAPRKEKQRYQSFLVVFFAGFVCYLAMLYFLQLIVFGVGLHSDHAISMTRYVNIYFSGFALFTILIAWGSLVSGSRPMKVAWVYIMAILTLSILVGSKAQRLERSPYELEIELLAEKMEAHLDMKTGRRIAVIPGQNDHELGMRLLYHLLPHRLNYGAFPMESRDAFEDALQTYEYVVVQYPDSRTIEWLGPHTGDEIESGSFFRISPSSAEGGDTRKAVSLERLF